LHRLTYATTTHTGVSGRVQTGEDRWENMIDIHNMGKRDTRYMRYQKSKAPLLDHSAVSSKREYVTFPLGDCAMNTEMARTFRGNVDSGRGKNPAQFDPATTYSDAMVFLSPKELKAAKLPSSQPRGSRTKTLTSVNDMMETRPRSHIEHAPPYGELVDQEVVLHRPKPNLGLSGSWGLIPRSTYRHDLCDQPHLRR
jgi:hypothetical protein